MAAPAVIRSVRNDPGAHGILVNVANEREQIAIRSDEPCVIAPLEQVTGGRHRSLDAPGIAARDQTHDVAERRSVHLQREVDVVRHPAVGVQTNAVALERVWEDALERQEVVAAAKDGLAVIAT